jgi:hypothetical protein
VRSSFVARAVKTVVVGVELQACENAPRLSDVVRIFWADQEVNVYEAGLGRDVEAQLDVRKEQYHVGEPARGFVLEKFFVCVGDIVVGDGDRFDRRRQTFEGTYMLRAPIPSTSARNP